MGRSKPPKSLFEPPGQVLLPERPRSDPGALEPSSATTFESPRAARFSCSSRLRPSRLELSETLVSRAPVTPRQSHGQPALSEDNRETFELLRPIRRSDARCAAAWRGCKHAAGRRGCGCCALGWRMPMPSHVRHPGSGARWLDLSAHLSWLLGPLASGGPCIFFSARSMPDAHAVH
jgi:hypothetical protein